MPPAPAIRLVTIRSHLASALNRALASEHGSLGAAIPPRRGRSTPKQIMLLLSVADEIGDAGGYKLIPAMSAIDVTLMDAMGNELEMMADAEDPGIIGGGTEDPEADDVSTKIIVNGVNVMVNAGDCGGDAIDGPWMLSNLTSLVPEATAGHGDFTGLDDGGMDPMMNASPGWIKFARGSLVVRDGLWRRRSSGSFSLRTAGWRSR